MSSIVRNIMFRTQVRETKYPYGRKLNDIPHNKRKEKKMLNNED